MKHINLVFNLIDIYEGVNIFFFGVRHLQISNAYSKINLLFGFKDDLPNIF